MNGIQDLGVGHAFCYKPTLFESKLVDVIKITRQKMNKRYSEVLAFLSCLPANQEIILSLGLPVIPTAIISNPTYSERQ